MSHEIFLVYTGSMRSNPVERKQTRLIEILILIAICLGYFMVILDSTAVNVALPNIQQQLGGTVNELQWIVDGYLLVFASVLLTGGAFGDRLGNKGVFLVGLVLFTASSALCGAAQGMWMLQIARALQGLGAGFGISFTMPAMTTAVVSSAPKERSGIASGILNASRQVGSALGVALLGSLVLTAHTADYDFY